MPQELATLDDAITLLESQGGDFAPWTDVDWSNGSDIGSGLTRGTPPYVSVYDREDGKYLPFYETEQDLWRQLSSVRRFLGLTELTEAVSTALRVYVFGAGIEVGVQAAMGAAATPELIDDVKRFVERFCEENSLVNSLDTEIHQRSVADGEALVTLEREGNGIVADLIETVQLTEPRNKSQLDEWLQSVHGLPMDSLVTSWSFGVLSPRRRSARAMCYHVIYDGCGNDWDCYTVDQFVHVKRNCPRSAKRGVSDWIPVRDRVTQSYKLVRNMAHGAALQAAIAWILESPAGTSQSQITSVLDAVKARQTSGYTPAPTWSSRSTANYPPGSILAPTPGLQYKAGPMGAERNAGFQVIEEMVERLIGTRWLMPYSMISGDASNNNFASSLVAESPFVKAREADQQFYGGALKSLIWKAIKMAIRFGWIDTRGMTVEQLQKMVTVKVDFTSPATRNRKELVDQLSNEVKMGFTSRKTASGELGRTFDDEVALGARPEGDAAMVVAGEVATGADGEPAATPAEEALNGAQIASLMDILDAVTSKRIPADTAFATMMAAFPSLGANVLNGILQPLRNYVSPILADGSPNPAAGSSDVTGATGEMANISTQQWNRNTKAIRKILDEFKAGGSRVIAKGLLTALSIPDDKAEEYLNDVAKDGKIDAPELNPTEAAAMQGALESVHSTDEAKAILESLKTYP